MRIKDETIGAYVGLNDTGEVVQYFEDAEAAWNTETHADSIVSVGYVTATPSDYDELFNTEPERCPYVDRGSCDGPGICPLCDAEAAVS